MDEYEHRPEETVSDVSQLSTPEGSSEGSEMSPAEEQFTLSELKTALGRDYSSKDEALKALKETFSYVGKAGQLEKELELRTKELAAATTPSATSGLAKQVDELSRELKAIKFYEANPALKEHADIISALGPNPEEAIKSPAWRKISEHLTGGTTEQRPSVMPSSPRISSPSKENYEQEFQTAVKTGNWVPFLEKYKGVTSPKVE